MKVLIITGWYPSKYSLANGDFVFYQTKGLITSGIEASVAYAHLDFRMIFYPTDIFHKYTFCIEDGIPTFRLTGFFFPKINSFFLRLWTRRFGSLFRKYQEKFGNPEILHAHTFLGGMVAMYLSEKYDIPYIITEHQTSILSGDIPNWKIPHMRNVYNNASTTIAVSNGLKKKMETMFAVRKAVVVPNFIDTTKFNIGHQKQPGFNFIAIGDLIERKGFDVLIKAFKLFVSDGHEDAALTILGNGPWAEKLTNLVTSMNLSQNIFFPGRCIQDEVAEYLKRSDVFVLSSRIETFGIVLIEAMASGLPVISTNCYGPSDIVTTTTGLLIPVDDIEAMKEAMVYMYHNKNLYDKNQIREYVLENFSNEIISNRLKEIYKSLLK